LVIAALLAAGTSPSTLKMEAGAYMLFSNKGLRDPHGRLRERPLLARNHFPVIVLARHNPNRALKQIAVLTVRKGARGYVWRLQVRPGATTYIAEANGQLPDGPIWKPAQSHPFGVRMSAKKRAINGPA
jgi:hypothetical protein